MSPLEDFPGAWEHVKRAIETVKKGLISQGVDPDEAQHEAEKKVGNAATNNASHRKAVRGTKMPDGTRCHTCKEPIARGQGEKHHVPGEGPGGVVWVHKHDFRPGCHPGSRGD